MNSFTILLTIALASAQDIAQMSCDEGYDLQGKTCVRNVRESATFNCPEGILLNDQCVFRSPPTVKCPAGSSIVDGVCSVVGPVEKIKKDCARGFEDSGYNCYKTISGSLTTVCAFGEYDPIEQLCITEKVVPIQVQQFCPPNTVEDGKGCTMSVPLKTMSVCENGALEDGSCVYTNQEPSLDIGAPYCPADSEEQDGICVRQLAGDVIEICPEGEPSADGECEIVVTKKVDRSPACPTGYERNGLRCQHKREGFVVSICPDGSEEDGESCARFQSAATVKSHPVCPEGFETSETKEGCSKTEVYDCTPPVAGKDASMRGTQTQTVAQTCERKQYADPIYDEACPEGFEFNADNVCDKKVSVEKTSICNIAGASADACYDFIYKAPFIKSNCEAPYVEVDGACSKSVVVPSKVVCANTGSSDIANCFATQTVEKLVERGCPAGYELNDGICYQRVISQPDIVCEDQDKSIAECSIKHRVAPVVRAVCPAGANQDPNNHEVCSVRSTFPAVSACANGSSVEDCFDKIEVPYTYQCPFGSVQSKSGCTKVKAYEALEYCEDGATLINNSCMTHVPATNSCPRGTQLIADYCVGTITKEPIVTFTKTCYGKGCEAQQ
eukprot:GHVH01007183.1.p1 GENE.GHVH01007183.1~~GHVH01007183.1.p1  ORF type:complete len:614 (+),score=84.16 GHVH01007183.1:435-2276(+)